MGSLTTATIILFAASLIHVVADIPCHHGSWNGSFCLCDPGWTLLDCSVLRVTMPPFFRGLDFGLQYRDDPYGDEHPLFPQNDVVDVVFDNSTQVLRLRTSTIDLNVSGVKISPHGGDTQNPSWRLFFLNPIFNVGSIVLKSTLSFDPSFLRERLVSRLSRALGNKVYRQCYARAQLTTSSSKVYLLQESLEENEFSLSRYGRSSISYGYWKVGGNHASHPVTPLSPWSKSSAGTNALNNATLQIDQWKYGDNLNATFNGTQWMQTFAMICMSSSWDCIVQRHNYYLHSDANANFQIIPYDFDRTLGIANIVVDPKPVTWDVMFCFVFGDNPFCNNMQQAFLAQYNQTLSWLLGEKGYIGSGYYLHDLKALDAQVSQLRPAGHNNTFAADIDRFIQSRSEFIVNWLRS